MAKSNVKTSFINLLKTKARVSINIPNDCSMIMAANEQYLIYFPKDRICIRDVQGYEKRSIQRHFDVIDTCGLSYRNSFLILSENKVYSLDLNESRTHQLKEINKEFNSDLFTFTSYEDRLIIWRKTNNQSIIDEYNILNWQIKQTYNPPSNLSNENKQIYQIRFNSDGNYLGVIIRVGDILDHPFSFALCHSNNMNILQITEFGYADWNCWMISLPNQQFLVNTITSSEKLFLFDSNGYLKEKSNLNKPILCSTALIDHQCLIGRNSHPPELCFYDL